MAELNQILDLLTRDEKSGEWKLEGDRWERPHSLTVAIRVEGEEEYKPFTFESKATIALTMLEGLQGEERTSRLHFLRERADIEASAALRDSLGALVTRSPYLEGKKVTSLRRVE